MRLRVFCLLVSALFSAPLFSSVPGQAPSEWVGTWEGDLDAGGVAIPTVFHLALEGDALTGTVDSPAQNVFGLEITEISFGEDGTGTIVVGVVGARYTARLEDGSLVGEWSQRGVKLPLVCSRTEVQEIDRVPGQERFVGSWEGTLNARGQKLRIRFHIEEDPTGRLVGTTDSPDQGARGVPISRIQPSEDGHVEIAIEAFGGKWNGELLDEGATLFGDFLQGGLAIPLELARTEAPAPKVRPQTPAPPFPYSNEDVVYRNEAADVTIAGTLTVPPGRGPFPAALLITGSGPQDRDETLFDHKPFFVLADHLSRRGVAVLRVDDRGVGGTSAGSPDATSEDFAGDVLAGVRFLRARPEIDPAKVGLIGHSEGGLIAPMAAARAPDEIAFIVMLAGPGVTGEEILYEQSALLMRAAGQSEEEIDANRVLQERLFEVVREAGNATREALAERLREALEGAPGIPTGDAGEAIINEQIAQVGSAWMRFFLTYDPRPALEAVRCPVLALNGELDLQVPVRQNLDAISAAFDTSGNEDATVRELSSLNHLFQTCETGAFAEYDAIEQTIAPEALDVIAVWITERFGPAG